MLIMHRSFSFDGNSIDKEARTAEIVWSSGARVLRNWRGQTIYEELDMSDDAIDLSRLNDNAPLLIDHNSSSDNLIGVIVPGSAYIRDNKGYATVRFGSDARSELFFQKIIDKILTKLSVGYSILKTERIQSRNNDVYDTIMVRKWSPYELSFVAIPADQNTGIRSIEENQLSLDLYNTIEKGNDMEQIKDQEVQPSEIENNSSTENIENKNNIDSSELMQKEIKRFDAIEKIVRAVRLEDDLAKKLFTDGTSVEDARRIVLERIEETYKKDPHIPTITYVNPVESHAKRNEAISCALLHRYLPEQFPLDESSARYKDASLCEIARVVTGSHSIYGKAGLIERALSTSDFPNLLQNVLNKSLRKAYADVPKTYEPLVRKVTVPDFKPIKRVQMGDAPILLEKAEHGQYQAGNFSDATESYAIREWGRVITITRQMLINDDLSAMLRIPSMLARRAAELESDLAWNTLLKNAVMGDGVPLFDVRHGNLAKNQSNINVMSIAEAKTAMRVQKGLNGARLSITPYYLITSSANEINALQFMFPTTPNTDQNTNPYKSSLKLIVEPRLDDFNPNAWFLAADLGQIDLIEMAYLQGQEGLYMEQKVDFNTDGVSLKVRLDVEAKAIDWRGFYRNDGLSGNVKSSK
jgi:hypothetical protein